MTFTSEIERSWSQGANPFIQVAQKVYIESQGTSLEVILLGAY